MHSNPARLTLGRAAAICIYFKTHLDSQTASPALTFWYTIV